MGWKIRLLGLSLGGLHIIELLSDRSFKDRVIRVVLLSPFIYHKGDEEFTPSWLTIARGLPGVFQSSIVFRQSWQNGGYFEIYSIHSDETKELTALSVGWVLSRWQ
jgi:alpha-beta hydrolase superfamily lysophospholipase